MLCVHTKQVLLAERTCCVLNIVQRAEQDADGPLGESPEVEQQLWADVHAISPEDGSKGEARLGCDSIDISGMSSKQSLIMFGVLRHV